MRLAQLDMSDVRRFIADDDLAINGFWKEGADGLWVNLASAISYANGKVRVDFSITDGGVFDAESVECGVDGCADRTRP